MIPRIYSLVVFAGVVLFSSGCTFPSQAFKPKPYPCVMGCDDERFTPDKGYYYDQSAAGKQRALSEFYEKHR